MANLLKIDARDIEKLYARYADAEAKFRKAVDGPLKTLGDQVVGAMRAELEPVRYTGEMEKSVTAKIEIRPKAFTLEVGPTAAHSTYIQYGTQPHWAPIAPLKRWAAVKLGDENAAYAVRWSIHERGTSVFCQDLYGSMANNFYTRTWARSDVKGATQAFRTKVMENFRKELSKK